MAISPGAIETAQELSGTTRQFITFTIGASVFGVDVMAVREITAWVETTPLPNTPEYVRGVINLRGAIVPVLDLRARFGIGMTEPTKYHVVIIVSLGKRLIGLLVDAVSDIVSVGEETIKSVPEVETDVDQRFIEGILTLPEQVVALVALDKLMTRHLAQGGHGDGDTAHTE